MSLFFKADKQNSHEKGGYLEKWRKQSLRDNPGKLSSLIKTYFQLGGKHMQFNVISRDQLLEAQKSPEKHRDLVVRVAGYSAYFVQLTPGIQNEIMGRMEYETA